MDGIFNDTHVQTCVLLILVYMSVPDDSSGKWQVRAGVYYDAWSGHGGANLTAYVEGLTKPQQFNIKLDSLSEVKYENGHLFMALVTINITNVSILLKGKD